MLLLTQFFFHLAADLRGPFNAARFPASAEQLHPFSAALACKNPE
jgi:hypothetical protein